MGGYSLVDAQSVSVREETHSWPVSYLPRGPLWISICLVFILREMLRVLCPSVSSQGLDEVTEVKGPLVFTSTPWRSDFTFVWRGSPSP